MKNLDFWCFPMVVEFEHYCSLKDFGCFEVACHP